MPAMTRRTAIAGVSAFALTASKLDWSGNLVGSLQLMQSPVQFGPIPKPPFKIDDRVIKYTNKNTIFVEATELQLDANSVSPGSDLVILAEQLTIKGRIALPGRNVTLIAREINFLPDAVVDTSAISFFDRLGNPVGGFTKDDRAPPGSGSNDAPHDGSPGPSGGAGGAITIAANSLTNAKLVANGKSGSFGQNGGNGYNGTQGRPDSFDGHRADYPAGPNDCTHGEPGGDGPDGSMPGSGGPGGAAGKAGMIRISLTEKPGSLAMEATPGRPGVGGSPGNTGNAGPPGRGGRSFGYKGPAGYCHGKNGDPSDPACSKTCYELPRERDGNPGRSFSNGTPRADGAAAPKVLPVVSYTDGSADMARLLTLGFAELIISRCELDYIGGNLEAAAKSLLWINSLCRKAIEVQPHLADSWRAKDYRTSLLITQLRQCQNFFGADRSFVPSLRPQTFDNVIRLGLDAADSLQADHDRIESYISDVNRFTAQASQFVQNTQAQISELSDKISRLITEQDSEQKEAERLDALATSIGIDVDKSSEDFKRAVSEYSRASGGCDAFNEIKRAGTLLTAIKAVSTVAGGGLPAFAALSGALDSFKPPADASFLDGLIHINKALGNAISGGQNRVSDIRSAWQQVQSAINPADPTQTPPLILLDEADYKKTLASFRNLPQAQALGALLDRYFQTLNARNKKYEAIRALVTQRNQLRMNIEGLRAEAQRAEELRAQANQPGMAEFSTILRRQLNDTKRSISTLFAQQARAISYYQGEDFNLPRLQETRVSEMRKIFYDLSVKFADAKQRQGMNPGTFELPLLVDRAAYPEAFAIFDRESYLPFVISDTESGEDASLERRYGVTLRGVIVELNMRNLGSSPSAFRGTLTQMGTTLVKTKGGGFSQFTHQPRTLSVDAAYDAASSKFVSDRISLGGNEDYVDLSPYGSWRVNLFKADIGKFPVANCESIRLRFFAKGFAFEGLQTASLRGA